MTVLYLSQDGIADHIGQSQVAPYILGLGQLGYDIHLISAEKAGTEAIVADYRQRFAAVGVRWTTVPYHKPLIGTLRDMIAMTRAARRIMKTERITVVHCRSHPTIPAGMAVKRWAGAKLLFDFRDFWADTGIAKGRFLPVYRFFKRLERYFIRASDHVNCLTQRAAEHLLAAYPEQRASWSVIPCCADFALFQPSRTVAATRSRLGISHDATVLLYLGSIGPDYLLDRMMALFAELRLIRDNAVFLFVVNNAAEEIRSAVTAAGIPAEAIKITSAPRAVVPELVGSADLSVSFRRNGLNMVGCSPTKLGETLACGVPVIANTGLGDLDSLLSLHVNGSVTLPDFTPESLRAGLEQVLNSKLTPEEIRESALALRLESGVDAYAAVYEALGESR